jgi:hypothetical protein
MDVMGYLITLYIVVTKIWSLSRLLGQELIALRSLLILPHLVHLHTPWETEADIEKEIQIHHQLLTPSQL